MVIHHRFRCHNDLELTSIVASRMTSCEGLAPASDNADEVIEILSQSGSSLDSSTNEDAVECDTAAEVLGKDACKLTLALVKSNGLLVTKVIDSRSDNMGEAWQELECSKESGVTVHRLVIAEDLPKFTETMLQEMLGEDHGVLVDHTADKDRTTKRPLEYPDHLTWPTLGLQLSKAVFHINLSEPPAAVSVALPYEIHAKAKRREDRFTQMPSIAEMHNRIHTAVYWTQSRYSPRGLYPSWDSVPKYRAFYRDFFLVAYRRISIKLIPAPLQESPICKILSPYRTVHYSQRQISY